MDGPVKWRVEILDAIEHVQRHNPDVHYRAIAVELITWALELLDEDEQLEVIAEAYRVWAAEDKPRLPMDRDAADIDPPDGWPPIE